MLADLPDPDRVFVGGGGLGVLDAALGRLRPGGVVGRHLRGHRPCRRRRRRASDSWSQVSVSRGVPIGADGAMRLQAENPVFVCWGPRA